MPAIIARRARRCTAILMLFAGLGAPVQSQTRTATPKFEVVSIKPCRDGDFQAGRGGGGGMRLSPGLLIVNCETVARLIPQAYLNSAERAIADPHFVRLLRQTVRGGPSWIDSDLYRIEAKTEGDPGNEMMLGPMMKALLENRFRLKIHRETREIPVYALSVASGGPKLRAAQNGSCVPVDRDHPFTPPAEGQPMPRVCGGVQGTNDGLETYGQTMAGLCLQLAGRLDREVIDKTGITGMFDIHLEAPRGYLFAGLEADGAPAPDPSDIFAAFQNAVRKLGLRLERTRGPDQFLVIDHVEKPSEN
jgi:uncharacterized protein (TIGR03435 family)